jgi:hypothetical protein
VRNPQAETTTQARHTAAMLHRVDPLGPVGEVLVDLRGVEHRVAAAATADRVVTGPPIQPVVVTAVQRGGLAVVTLQDVLPAGPVEAVVTLASNDRVVAAAAVQFVVTRPAA